MTGDVLPLDTLSAVLRVTRPTETLGKSLFLYVALLRSAGAGGTVIRTRERLAGDLSVPESRIDAWLSRLVAVRLVRIQSSNRFLMVRISSWPGSDASPSQIPSSSAPHIEESYSHIAALQDFAGDRGAGKGDLVVAAQEFLGENAATELEIILRTHSLERVTRIANQVRNTPPEKIKKSKLALFRYLIGNNRTNDPNPNTRHPTP